LKKKGGVPSPEIHEISAAPPRAKIKKMAILVAGNIRKYKSRGLVRGIRFIQRRPEGGGPALKKIPKK